uniref:Dolichol-phosphate mannosyltransferase subunit 3 n=1 Tax=Panagrellus redivivus TaxID=6233 RepID=A0A7E4W980_PANRE
MATELVLKSKQLLIGSTSLFAVLYLLGYGITAFLVVAFFALAIFGLYSIGKVGKMASQFDPCEEAKEELEREIVEAKRWYSTNGHSHVLEPKQEKAKEK